MPTEAYPDQIEPKDQQTAIWRFMNLKKFRDLMATRELYFCRADRFADESEGLPPEEYLPILGLNPLDLKERRQIDDSIGCAAHFRESFYVNCWHLFREETAKMWEDYGRDGVAICSRYGLLKSGLGSMSDRSFLGLVRYGSKHLTGWNVLRFITTKQAKYADEREVRAFLWIIDPHAGVNRHIDAESRIHTRPLTPPPDRVLPGQRRTVDLWALLTQIVVSPWASSEDFDGILQIVKNYGFTIPVRHSELSQYRRFLPLPSDRALFARTKR
jgi:hypothetical protein